MIDLFALYFSPNIIRVIKSIKQVGTLGGSRGAYGVLLEKSERKRPLERLRRRWEDNIKMARRNVGWGTDWIDLA